MLSDFMMFAANYPAKKLQLLSCGRVSVNDGPPHGTWAFQPVMEEPRLMLFFHHNNEESKAKMAILKPIQCTDVWEKTNGPPDFKFFLTVKKKGT